TVECEARLSGALADKLGHRDAVSRCALARSAAQLRHLGPHGGVAIKRGALPLPSPLQCAGHRPQHAQPQEDDQRDDAERRHQPSLAAAVVAPPDKHALHHHRTTMMSATSLAPRCCTAFALSRQLASWIAISTSLISSALLAASWTRSDPSAPWFTLV